MQYQSPALKNNPTSDNSFQRNSRLPNKQIVRRLVQDRLNIGKTPNFVNGAVAKILSGVLGSTHPNPTRPHPPATQSTQLPSRIVVRRKRVQSQSAQKRTRSSSLKSLPKANNTSTFEKRFQQIREQLRAQSRQQHSRELKSKLDQHMRVTRQYGISESKVNTKVAGRVMAYAANTHQGIVRTYNEDRVSIVSHFGSDKKSSFFAVYDGHGGSNCVDYLRDNMHRLLAQEALLMSNPKQALRNAILKAQDSVLKTSQQTKDFSGSCLLICLVMGEIAYLANVGDCRAVASQQNGTVVIQITNDHKPSDPIQQSRITKAGGSVYQNGMGEDNPCRVLPGRLSVSRTIGDLEAKDEKYGGNRNVVVAEPEIHQYTINENSDYIVLACDGIFDKLSNDEVCQQIFSCKDFSEDMIGRCIQAVFVQAFNKQTSDNVSLVMIAFERFTKKAKDKQTKGLTQSPSKLLSSRKERSTNSLASYKRLQTVKQVLRRNTPTRR